MVTAVRFSNDQEVLSIDYSGAKHACLVLPVLGDVITSISFATPGMCRLIFDYCGAISALPETLFFGYSGAIFERSKVSFH